MESTAVRNEVIVGIDPRERAGPALAWAADEALRRRSSLRLVVAVPPLPGGQHVDAPWNRSMLRMRGESALTDAVATVRALYAEVPLATELLDGTPAAVLCRRAARARMVVVGSRRLSRPEELLGAGSVAVPVSAGADCPVVVVGGPERAERRHPRLVVGVDGSASSGAALAFAVEEAALHGAALHAVWVWRRPFVSFGDEAAGLDERRRALAETVAGRGAQHPDVKITQEVLRGHPVEELARASTDALVVVVGRHGRGGYSGMRLGSVVHGLLHRAECPVITVPESRHG